MRPDAIEELLGAVASGVLDVQSAMRRLRDALSYQLPDADIDGHRHLRTGFPEVVFAAHKTTEQTVSILTAMFSRNGYALATHASADVAAHFANETQAAYQPAARTLSLGRLPKTHQCIGVVCAGTSDIPVFEEVAFTLEWLGHDVERSVDVGVAGIHRILANVERLRACRAIAVVAGMEGALPGVVAGLVPAPIVAVPTSVGYGVAAGGYAALLGMLSSCSPGVAVVNIDNGFGAAAMLHRIVSTAASA